MVENNSFGRQSFYKEEKVIILVIRLLFYLYILRSNLLRLLRQLWTRLAKRRFARLLSVAFLVQASHLVALSLFLGTYLFELVRGQFLNPSHTDSSVFAAVEDSRKSLKYNVLLISGISFFNLFSLLKILNNFFFHYLNLMFRSFSKARRDILVYFSVD